MLTAMSYVDAVEYLNGFINFERLPESRMDTRREDIERFRALLGELGDPQRDYPVIHIAGTKGKGSTAAILEAILRAAGYRVGLYTSPHLVTVRERIRIDGQMVTKRAFASLIDRIRRSAEPESSGERLCYRTVFEHLTAAALLEFSHRRVDVAIVETGLGGKLDATVVLDPALVVITPIGLDHTAILGDAIPMIAADKAHVIKSGVPAVTALQCDEAMRELARRAEEVCTSLTVAPGAGEFSVESLDFKGTVFRSTRKGLGPQELRLSLAGRFQLENLSTALTALEVSESPGIRVAPDAVRRGLAQVKCPGRVHRVRGDPPTIVDGSHNTMAVKALCAALAELAPGSRWRVVFSALHTKPVGEMMEQLASRTVRFHLAAIRFPKSATAEMLVGAARAVGVPYDSYASIPEAFEAAMGECAHGELVLATGSLYLAGEIIRHLRRLPPPLADGRIDDRM